MRITRLPVLAAVLILGLVATGAAMLASQERAPGQAKPSAPTKAAAQVREPTKSAMLEKLKQLNVRTIDSREKEVAGVEIRVVEEDSVPADDWPGYRTAIYRAGADGRVRIAVDHRFIRLTFLARPDDQSIGWAHVESDRLLPKPYDENPITLMLLPRNHHVEGTVVDSRGKRIAGVHVRAVQFNHEANGFAMDYPRGDEKPSLASAVTDQAGRYRVSLPQETTVRFAAYHPRFVGPFFFCKADDQTIRPVTLDDAGRIVGTVVDATTGEPIAGARVGAQRIEYTGLVPGGGWGSTSSDAHGRFTVGGLAPGVYNLLFKSSPKGRRFTAQAVEGVRVKAGEDARADLRLIAGRRLHGVAIEAGNGKPLVGKSVLCYNASYPRSGAACQGTYTDEHGRFEYFVPPGPAFVYINVTGEIVARSVQDDRDPDPVVLKQGYDPNAKRRAEPRSPVECAVRIRVQADAGDRPVLRDDRTLVGRVFDEAGSPLIAVRVQYNNNRTPNSVATDRLGMFRLKGLPHGPLWLGLCRNDEYDGAAPVPAEAVEVDVIFPQKRGP